ncbi:MAG: helix-turn-helix transcriptional regulator [Vagococcus sp.]|uniref:helix-turn-helix domain-containing protein n=1 Tax=Vagococcus sp. TaxID=1933889 RepID=UPI002FCC99A6
MSYTLGQKIKLIRIEKGLTMEEFGKLFKPVASDSIVSRWERDISTPINHRLKRIAELGNTIVEQLLNLEFETCTNCSFNLIKKEYNFCPICGTKKSS